MWLLSKDVFDRISAGLKSGSISSEEKKSFLTSMGNGDGARILSTAGSTAEISVQGVLTKEPDFFSLMFGGGNTSYSELIQALASAENDPEIENIVLRFDTPGGHVSGLLGAMTAIKETQKHTTAIIDSMALSAGYSLASQADEILASDDLSLAGSVGVAKMFFSFEEETTITNRESPDKIPDEKTEDGKAVIQDELDSVHKVLVGAIASGRGISEDVVLENFGKGRVFVAEEARKRGMIDGMVSSSTRDQNNMGGVGMTLEELKAKHPGLYGEAVNIGKEEEKERVKAHMTMGGISPKSMIIAMKAIESGEGWTSSVQAEYLAAQGADKEIEARVKDDADIGNVNPAAGKDNQDIVADLVAAEMGVK